MKISSSLIATFLLVSLIPLSLGSGLIYVTIHDAINENIVNHLESLALQQKKHLNEVASRNRERLGLIMKREQLKQSAVKYFVSNSPQHLMAINIALEDAQNTSKDIRTISLLDAQGKVRASTNKNNIGLSWSDRRVFSDGKKDVHINLLDIDEHGNLTNFLVGPLHHSDTLVGVLVVNSNANSILNIVSHSGGLGEGGESIIVARNKHKQIIYISPYRFTQAVDFSEVGDSQDFSSVVNSVLNKEEKIFRDIYDHQKNSVLATTKYIPSLDWGVIVKIDHDEAFSSLYDLREMIVVGLILLSICIVLASIHVAKRIGQPIERLAIEAKNIGEGRSEVKLDNLKNNIPTEIESLKTSIEKMKAALASQNEIEQEARESMEMNEWFLDEIVENLPNMVFVKDANELRFVRLNKAGENLLGYSKEDLLGKNDYDFFPREEADFFVQKDREVLEGGKMLTINEEPIETRDKGTRYLHTKKIPIYDPKTGRAIFLLGISEDITQRKEQEEKILQQAHYDTLTGLPNRFLALDRLTQLINDAKRKRCQAAVLFLDLDDFKKINDTLGHEEGDKLLKEAANRLCSAVRQRDTIGRLGGDEFIVLLGDLHSAEAVAPVAESLLRSLRESYLINGREIVISVSIGISLYPDDGDNPLELLRHSDSAMYYSKEHGRNTYSFFTEEMNKGIARRFQLEEQLHNALQRKEFYLQFQPKMDLVTGDVVGAEALLRWDSEILGEIFPDEFIPIAEQTGLIVQIGQFVVIEALYYLKRWQKLTDRALTMAVNLSPRQFRDPNLVEFIRSAVDNVRISPDSLELEITEGVLLDGRKPTSAALNSLHDSGFRLAMDDFGTGYSSLSYLRNYPFDVLKIDREFINGITEDSADLELVNAAIAMAHGLGLKVVAEGVENIEQKTLLILKTCDYGQGRLFSMPVSPEQFEKLLGIKPSLVSVS